MIDVRDDQLKIIAEVLRTYLPETEVRAFGSRVSWTAKDSSDLDLVVMGKTKLGWKTMTRLKVAFEASSLPFRVDVLDWHNIPEDFRMNIEKQYEVIQIGENKSSGMGSDTLGAIVDVIMGQSPPGETCNRFGEGLPLLNGPTEFGPFAPSPVQFTTDPRKRAGPGDILFCVRGSTTGRMNWADQEYAIGRGIAAIRHKNGKGFQAFLRALIAHRLPDLLLQATGSTFPNVSYSQLVELPCEIPSEKDQKAISHILGSLDDKIELNRRMNETLEDMARALFKSWFVDFDPVRAKAEGRDTGLPEDIDDLFPDEFADSKMGEMPRCWQPCAWGDLVTLKYGKSLPGYETGNGEYPVYGTNGRIGTHSQALCHHPGIIIGRKGAYRGVHFCNSPFFVIDTAFYIEPKTPLEILWAFFEILRQDINSIDSGFAMPSTSREDFYSLQVMVPPVEIQQQFVHLLNPIWVTKQHYEEESRTLAAICDVLIPKLLSGELGIKDPEKSVEDAA